MELNQLLVFTQFPKKSRKNVTYHTLDSADPITAILDQLHQLNIQSILVEGGTHTIEKFLSLNLWDEARVFTSPQKFSRGISRTQDGGSYLTTAPRFQMTR